MIMYIKKVFIMIKKTFFQCPNCSKPLKQGQKQYFCSNGHNFDIAKKGYVNLLLPSHTGTGTPGDSKEMLQSRREFLDNGYYEMFSNNLNEIIAHTLPIGKGMEADINILDAGCGEGYYIYRLKNWLTHLFSQNKVYYGIDVSKPAIHYASSRDENIHFAVASNYHVPILENSMDCILCIFAPRDEHEFWRILKPSGKLIVAAPNSRHLFSLRQLMYKNPDVIGQKGTVGEGFELLEQYNVNYNIHIKSKQDIMNLFMMTPYSRHSDKDTVEGLSEFSTEVDINIFVYQKGEQKAFKIS